MKQTAMRKIAMGLAAGLILFAGAAEAAKKKPKSPTYVGPLKCDSSCHDPWYKAWAASPHGKTYDLLKKGVRVEAKKKAGLEDKDYTADKNCLRCHTTWYGQKGGFNPEKARISADEPNLEQVGCEMCHSMRGGSQFRFTMKESKGKFKRTETEMDGQRFDYENACKRCHLHPKSPFQPSVDPKYKFNYAERVKKVHLKDKYFNADNKDQKIKNDHGKGVTESKALVIEDWGFDKKGKLRLKKGTQPFKKDKKTKKYEMVFK